MTIEVETWIVVGCMVLFMALIGIVVNQADKEK